jgi:predicted flap endonuclease-1-like 5' DNA nuclease
MTEPARDLPNLGRPAGRALDAQGITTLAEVAARSESELLSLHGVGPKAIRILREALEAEGRSFAAER